MATVGNIWNIHSISFCIFKNRMCHICWLPRQYRLILLRFYLDTYQIWGFSASCMLKYSCGVLTEGIHRFLILEVWCTTVLYLRYSLMQKYSVIQLVTAGTFLITVTFSFQCFFDTSCLVINMVCHLFWDIFPCENGYFCYSDTYDQWIWGGVCLPPACNVANLS